MMMMIVVFIVIVVVMMIVVVVVDDVMIFLFIFFIEVKIMMMSVIPRKRFRVNDDDLRNSYQFYALPVVDVFIPRTMGLTKCLSLLSKTE